MIRCYIDQVGSNRPGERGQIFNQETFLVDTMEKAMKRLKDKFFIERPKRKKAVYIDDKDGNAIEIGFIHNRWSRDCSHGGKSWWETNWVTFSKEEQIPLKELQ